MKKKIMFAVSSLAALLTFAFSLTPAFAFTHISSQMGLGARGTSVASLQSFLASNSSVYPRALVTGYFGPFTMNAVAQFQIAYDLPPVGIVGPLTLAKINSLIDSGKSIDVDAPIMSGIVANASSRTTFVTWGNNEMVRAKVFYSTTPISVMEAVSGEPFISGTSVFDSSLSMVKSFTLHDLMPSTLYYYVLESMDDSGNVTVSPALTFFTTN